MWLVVKLIGETNNICTDYSLSRQKRFCGPPDTCRPHRYVRACNRIIAIIYMQILLINVYLCQQILYAHTDGVVLVDPDYIKDRKVYGHVLAAFRYGREDLDVLGLTFRKDLFLSTEQIFPVKKEIDKPLTRLQERLIKKLGTNAYPFYFEVIFGIVW